MSLLDRLLDGAKTKATLHFPNADHLDAVKQLFTDIKPFSECRVSFGTDAQSRPTAAIFSPYDGDSAEADEIISVALAVGSGTYAEFTPPSCPACKRTYRQRCRLSDWWCLDCGHKYTKES